MPQVVVLDESASQHHLVKSVGGIIVQLGKIPEIEAKWREAKIAVGLNPDKHVKYSMSWEDVSQRDKLIEVIGKLDLKVVLAVLEDHRPTGFKRLPGKRSDYFIQNEAFKYVLQRLSKPQYAPTDSGGHFVIFDDCSEFPKHAKFYRDWARSEQPFGSETLQPLKSIGYSEALLASADGALNEIADLVVSSMTRWLAVKCANHLGKKLPEEAELDANASNLIGRFPTAPGSSPPKWQGYSIVAHKGRTENELHKQIDKWAYSAWIPF